MGVAIVLPTPPTLVPKLRLGNLLRGNYSHDAGQISCGARDLLFNATRSRALSPAELQQATEKAFASLPYHYRWLNDWEYV